MNTIVALTILGMVALAHGGYLHTPAVTYAHGLGAYHVAPTYGHFGYHAAPAVHTVGYAHHAPLVRIAREAKPDPQVLIAGGHHVAAYPRSPVVYGGAYPYGYGRAAYGYAPVRAIYG